MKKSFSPKASKTDRKRVTSMKDRDVKLTQEHPELDIKHIARLIVRKGLKPVAAKKSRSRQTLPGYESDDGPLTNVQKKEIERLQPSGRMKVEASLF